MFYLCLDRSGTLANGNNDLAVRVKAEFPLDRGAALFNHSETFAKPLVGFDPGAEVQYPNAYAYSLTGYWLYADFPLSYDPCVCTLDEQGAPNLSQITFYAEFLNNSSLTLTGTGTPATSSTQQVVSPVNSLLTRLYPKT